MPGGRTWREWSKWGSVRKGGTWDRNLAPFLEPGERVKHAFRATSGPRGTRWLSVRNANSLLGAAVGLRNYVVAVTDRAVVILRTSRVRFIPIPNGVIMRLPRATRLGPFAGNGDITVGGIQMYVWDLSDLLAVQAADNEIGYECPAPPSPWW